MEIIATSLNDCYLIRNNIIHDGRGYFLESFNHEKFARATGWNESFVQDNQSCSTYGVVRGLHFQIGEHAQAKLVRVLQGKVIDVVIDLRPQSSTFGKWFAAELSDDNQYQLFVPRGFGHGFSVLSPSAIFFYKCDNYYNKASEGGIHPFDADLAIDWGVPVADAILSEKDRNAESWQVYKTSLALHTNGR
jgi:dTDP-4-dehydrorhamnose 3,5-epimerase